MTRVTNRLTRAGALVGIGLLAALAASCANNPTAPTKATSIPPGNSAPSTSDSTGTFVVPPAEIRTQ